MGVLYKGCFIKWAFYRKGVLSNGRFAVTPNFDWGVGGGDLILAITHIPFQNVQCWKRHPGVRFSGHGCQPARPRLPRLD